jgi:hypothetical protein
MATIVLGSLISLTSAVVFVRHLGPTLHHSDLRFKSAVGFIIGIYIIGSVLV